MDAREFLGIEPVDDELHWRLTVTPEVSTPGKFLFGGCGLAAGLVALEAASGRPAIWATAQYLSYAPTGSTVDYEVVLAVVGGHITQGRAVARVDGQEILTVNAALGTSQVDVHGVWVTPPPVRPPEECPARQVPPLFANSILDRIDVRLASGRGFEDLEGPPGDPCSALWARVPGHLTPSAATLAIFGDYVSGGASQPLGRRIMGRSLDNTLRMVQLEPTEWVLCDIRMHAVVGGYAQGSAFLWSQSGALLATASQSLSIRFWPDMASRLARPAGAS
ncbi:MAG: thioesterase family protein [Actinomycetota bacterium]|jgi:acyl-CoA thioesterase|nr:thioesterase family protein [Actinomycetota bacterium]